MFRLGGKKIMKKTSFFVSQRVKRLIEAIDLGLVTQSEAATLLKMNRETFRLYFMEYKERQEVEEISEKDLR